MRALVTGASGFLGRHLVDVLSAHGASVRAVVRATSPGVDGLRARADEVVVADVRDPTALARAVELVDVVFHCAALASYVAPTEALVAANVVGTRNLLVAARDAGVRRLVHVSSESVTMTTYDRVDVTEDTPLPTRFLDDYSRSKAAAERGVLAAHSAAFETCVLRAPWLWGEGDTSVFRALIGAVRARRFAWISDGSQRVTTCHVRNMAHALVLAGTDARAAGRLYHVGDEDHPTLRWFVEQLCAACDLDVPTARVPYALAFAAAAAADAARRAGVRAPLLLSRPYLLHSGRAWTLDDTRIRAELDYRPPVSFEDGFARVAEWVRAAGGVDAVLRARF